MEHGTELGIAIVVCLGLASGAALRWVAKKTGIPYTVAMLLLGIGGGVALKRWVTHFGDAALHYFGGELPLLSADLILFVFLPALVFESAFALDVHAFRRNLFAVTVLAVPAMIVSTLLTALLAFGVVGSAWGWSLTAALVFGALISATDPVAVVAVLRELGAPKRLSLLIEGESLLNDGTAIVAFTVLLALLVPSAHGGELDAAGTALRFVQVVVGGVAIGLVLAWVATSWIAATFNDPLVEITVTLVLAYSAMVIAEGLLHVSGVMAVVTAGLVMAGPGQSRISPEVRHFLHRFWQMLAFLANTLIFFLVGLVIALNLEGARLGDVALIGVVYVGIVAVRFAVTFGFLPVLRLGREPVRAKEATVMAWGGLRGAVSLALALVVSQMPGLDEELRGQVLRLTAGVVLLTILVNGTTTGWFLRKLGFVTPSRSEELARERAIGAALSEVAHHLDAVSADPELASLPWPVVRRELAARRAALDAASRALAARIAEQGGSERVQEVWRRALRVEREHYWSSFAEGVLGGVALRGMARELDHQLDELRAGRLQPPASRTPEQRGIRPWISRLLRRFGVPFGARELGRLTLLYDMWRAEAEAAGRVIDALAQLEDAADEAVDAVRRTYAGWRRRAKRRLEDLRTNLPEVAAAIEDRLARRIALNVEREQIVSMAERGVLPEGVADALREEVEGRMKELSHRGREVALPETIDLCRNAPLFRGLGEDAMDELAEATIEQALAPEEVLFREGDSGDALYVVARGVIRVSRVGPDGAEHEIDHVTRGEVVGEMALLGGERRNATATALTTAVVGRLSRKDFETILEDRPEVRRRVWAAFARRAFENAVTVHPWLRQLDRRTRRAWIGGREPIELADGESVSAGWLMLVDGELESSQGEHVRAPRLVDVGSESWTARGPCRVVRLPPAPEPRHGLDLRAPGPTLAA